MDVSYYNLFAPVSTEYTIVLVSDLHNTPYWKILKQICKKRGFLLRGSEFDFERCSKAVIDDFRKGKICRATLEIPK